MRVLCLLCVVVSLFTKASYAEAIKLADGHQIRYDEAEWEYVLSESTFKKTLGLIEYRSNPAIKGLIDTEVRFSNPKEVPNNRVFLERQCEALKRYWNAEDYQVELVDNAFCVVKSKLSLKTEKHLYQVIQTKQSQSRRDMFFVYSWTFHLEKGSLEESYRVIDSLRRLQ